MRIITISREFGSGGRELGKRLADTLGFDYYDREIITAIAQSQGLHEDYVEQMLDEQLWRTVPLSFHQSFSLMSAVQDVQVSLLEAQRKLLETIANGHNDFIIVGRNADIFLTEKRPFRIFVCAGRAAKIQRCLERAEPGENLSPKEIDRNMRRIDRDRAYSRAVLSDTPWGDPLSYDLTVNTTGWSIKDLTPAVAAYATTWFAQRGK